MNGKTIKDNPLDYVLYVVVIVALFWLSGCTVPPRSEKSANCEHVGTINLTYVYRCNMGDGTICYFKGESIWCKT